MSEDDKIKKGDIEDPRIELLMRDMNILFIKYLVEEINALRSVLEIEDKTYKDTYRELNEEFHAVYDDEIRKLEEKYASK